MKTINFQSIDEDFPSSFSITVSNLCTISKLKEVASSIMHSSPSDLIFFNGNKELLDDDQAININDDKSTIFVAIRNTPSKIPAKDDSNLLQNFTPKSYFNRTNLNQTFSDNDDIENDKSELINLKVYLFNGKVANSRCTKTTTVLQAKEILSSLLNLQSDKTQLYYNNLPLNNDMIISEIHQIPNATFYFDTTSNHSKNLTINIVDGTVAKTKFKDTATVGKMKEVLAQQFNTSPRNISVIVDDPNASDDSTYIKDLNLEKGNVLYTSISPTHQIKIKLSNGKTVKGSFNNMATIGTVKNVLANTLGFPINELYVTNSIVDDSTPLIELEENDDDNCRIEIFSSLQFTTNDGKVINTRFKETATIKKAKIILAQKLGVDFNDLQFDLPKYITDDTLIKDISLPNNTINITILKTKQPSNTNNSLQQNNKRNQNDLLQQNNKRNTNNSLDQNNRRNQNHILHQSIERNKNDILHQSIDRNKNDVLQKKIERNEMKKITFQYENGTKIHGRFGKNADVEIVKNTISDILQFPAVDLLLLLHDEILLDHQLISSLSLSENDFILIQKRNIPY